MDELEELKHDNARLVEQAADLAAELTEAERVLRIISELEITEHGQYIPNAAAVLKQIAINYFTNSVMDRALRDDAKARGIKWPRKPTAPEPTV